MKKKVLFIMLILVVTMIGISFNSDVDAACSLCSSNQHSKCYSQKYTSTNASNHTITCCCEKWTSTTGHDLRDNGYKCISDNGGIHATLKSCACGESYTGSTENCTGGTATCKAKKICEKCKHEYGSLGNHKYENEGNCNGKKCSVCNNTTGYTSHDFGAYSDYSDTDHRRKCTRSGCRNQYSYQNHSYNDYTVDKEATCTEAGSKSKHCTVCGHKSNITSIPAKSHTNSDWRTSSAQHWKECTVCNTITIAKTNHSGGAATCTAKAKCSTCNESYGNVKEHTPSGWETSSTQHWKECTKCGTITTSETNHSGRYGDMYC